MRKLTMKAFQQNSYLADNNADYLENLYEDYLQDPNSIDSEWRDYFHSLSQNELTPDISHQSIRAQFRELAKSPITFAVTPIKAETHKQVAVDALIQAFRRFGHLNANTDPLNQARKQDPRLELSYHDLSHADLVSVFSSNGLLDTPQGTLETIYSQLKRVYCGSIGVEYSTISDEKERAWLRDYVEKRLPKMQFSAEIKRNILKQLIHAETLEKYLDVKYVGQKRFSVEGTESLIPLLDELTNRASSAGIQEMVIGMAHRGRLNVLLNIMGQSSQELFQEFEGKAKYGLTSGDVKYHRGYSRDVKTQSGSIHLSLAFNPSHLEFICPVIMGSVRARQERQNGRRHDYAIAIMIHGDAAFSGQGVVMETLNMSQTRAHHVGGSLHIILNNQIGFTTSNPHDARSSYYCSDLAKMLDAPIFHVNADDPEAVVAVTQLALDYRMTFHKDIFIDLVGYRRHGHQEADEPTVTQPLMYQLIKQHSPVRTLYSKTLIENAICTAEEVEKWTETYRNQLDEGRQIVETLPKQLSDHYIANWTPYINQLWETQVDTAVPKNRLQQLGERLTHIPETFKLQRQVDAIITARRKMTANTIPVDWGYAEMMAYATLLDEGYSVRLVGEDSRRGTFFHRQATLFDQVTGEEYPTLQHITPTQAYPHIFDSLLSECAALGFEYGYSTAEPKALVLWEAQFGDFANGAQVIIDQFISSGWEKWRRLSGLVMLLPHGYEGMGPEHSSARLERYLQLCAQSNIQVCIPTTASQIFHLLRRQVLRPFRSPLVVLTPKSFLRHPLAASPLENLSHGSFLNVISEIDPIDPKLVDRVILCSGKVYIDLLTKRREKNIKNIAIIRIEQLYPFPQVEFETALKEYAHVNTIIWCQEEPENQGAWFITQHRILASLKSSQTLKYVGRAASAAAAAGYPALHNKQQIELVEEALGLKTMK